MYFAWYIYHDTVILFFSKSLECLERKNFVHSFEKSACILGKRCQGAALRSEEDRRARRGRSKGVHEAEVSEIGLSRNGFAIGESNKPPGREKNGLDSWLAFNRVSIVGTRRSISRSGDRGFEAPPLSLSYRSWACISSAYKVHKMG